MIEKIPLENFLVLEIERVSEKKNLQNLMCNGNICGQKK